MFTTHVFEINMDANDFVKFESHPLVSPLSMFTVESEPSTTRIAGLVDTSQPKTTHYVFVNHTGCELPIQLLDTKNHKLSIIGYRASRTMNKTYGATLYHVVSVGHEDKTTRICVTLSSVLLVEAVELGIKSILDTIGVDSSDCLLKSVRQHSSTDSTSVELLVTPSFVKKHLGAFTVSVQKYPVFNQIQVLKV